jgi:hypothetical protein
MELPLLEAGFSDCPLTHPFEPMGPILTHCWVGSF